MSRLKSRRTTTTAKAYVYAYAAVAGRPSARLLARLPAMPEAAPPRGIHLTDDLTLVVCDVPSGTYSPQSVEPRLADLEWVSQCGAAHHAVTEALSDAHAVMPFRLFTIFSSEAKARATVRKKARRIAAAMERVKGHREWVLRIGRPDPARARVPPVARRQPDSSRPATGTAFLQAKAEERRDARSRAARVKADLATVFEMMREAATAADARPIEAGTTLILDAAFLVSTRKAAAFQKTLTRVAKPLLDVGCPVSLTGPWPPYSFASLD